MSRDASTELFRQMQPGARYRPLLKHHRLSVTRAAVPQSIALTLRRAYVLCVSSEYMCEYGGQGLQALPRDRRWCNADGRTSQRPSITPSAGVERGLTAGQRTPPSGGSKLTMNNNLQMI